MSDSPQTKLTLSINRDRCQGHSRCCSLAPELFESDDLGYGVVRGDGAVPDALLDKAKLAIGNCPEHAIELQRE